MNQLNELESKGVQVEKYLSKFPTNKHFEILTALEKHTPQTIIRTLYKIARINALQFINHCGEDVNDFMHLQENFPTINENSEANVLKNFQ